MQGARSAVGRAPITDDHRRIGGGSPRSLKLGVRDYVVPSAPDASLLLTKTLPAASHGGGVFWTTPDHPDYRAIRQWIAEGANDN